MEALLPTILSDLDVIASISEGDTLTSAGGNIQVIQHEGAGRTRAWRGESRQTTLSTIELKVSYAIEYSTLVTESIYLHKLTQLDALQVNMFNKRLSALQRIKEGLDFAKRGISKLKKTYEADKTTQGKINTLIGNIEFHIGTIQSKLKMLNQQIELHNSRVEPPSSSSVSTKNACFDMDE